MDLALSRHEHEKASVTDCSRKEILLLVSVVDGYNRRMTDGQTAVEMYNAWIREEDPKSIVGVPKDTASSSSLASPKTC